MNASFSWWGAVRPWLVGRQLRLLEWTLPVVLAAAVVFSPWLTLGLFAMGVVGAWLLRDRNAIVLVLVALMVNVKFNYYAMGALTIFPEFPFLLLAGALQGLRWMEGERLTDLREFLMLFAWFLVAGALSAVNALQVGRVASKGLLMAVAMAIFYFVLRGVRSRHEMRRTLIWVEASALISGVYAIVQVAGGALGWNTSLSFLEKYSNPDIYLGIGAPVLYRLTKTFRANGFFNDPNILAGYLAGVISLVFALRAGHAAIPGLQARARFETILLMVLSLAMLLTLSRSGFLATACGLVCVLYYQPYIMRRASFWFAGAVAVGVAVGGSLAAGIDPFLLVVRLGSTFDRADVSSRQHYEVGLYALRLLERFPFTGAGLRNFGYYFGGEVDAEFPNMMAHNAPLDFLAETGLFGGLAFLFLVVAVMRRPWKALRSERGLRARDPERHSMLVGLLAAMLALNVANLFYDYYLRTFIWVFSALTVCASEGFEADQPRASA